MTAQELINEINDVCGNNLDREIEFHGTLELLVQDETKVFPVRYGDCRCQTNHPAKLTIHLHEQ